MVDSVNSTQAAVIFGGHSPIALACAEYLSTNCRVFLVTRCIDTELSSIDSNTKLLQGDISKPGEAHRIISDIYEQGYELSDVFFFQRYRGSAVDAISSHMNVELFSIEEAVNAIKLHKKEESVISVLLSSSPAAYKVVDDQDLNYHIVKASQEALVRYISLKMCKHKVYINGIRVSSIVFKERAKDFWNSKNTLVRQLKSLSPSRSLQDSDTVAKRFASFSMAAKSGITGQIISLEEGFELLDSIQVAKTSLEMTES